MKTDINVTPMIDVLLVLLVIFMLAVQHRLVLPLNVPSPVTSSAPTQSPQIVVDLKSDASYALNGTSVARESLGEHLRELYAGGGRGVLFVRTAPHRRYKDVVEVMDIARGAGVAVIGYMP
jgi:biopolymer transport protein ExbD